MKQTEQNAATKSRAKIVKWVVAAFLLLTAVVVVKILPHGYSDDLSLTGKGRPSLVLIRDKNAVQTYELSDVMNDIRGQYEANMDFILTDFNTAEGRRFMDTTGAPRATLVLLDGNGKLVKIIYHPQTPETLKRELAAVTKE
ncbi:MAG: hypothetical protein WA632_00975 [Gallionella sp.]